MGHYLDKDGNRVTIDDNGNLTLRLWDARPSRMS